MPNRKWRRNMTKFYNSLNTKLVASFVVLVVAISGMTFLYTYDETKRALLNSTQDTMRELSSTMASQINGTAVEALQPGDENTTSYLELVSQLRAMRNGSEMVTNCYLMKYDGGAVLFLVDDIEDDPAMINDPYEDAEVAKIQAALSAPQVSDQIYTDQWGSYITGYAPVMNANGTAVAVLGIDMNAHLVIERQNFIGNTIYIILGVSALLAAAIIAVFSLTIIRDIKKLNLAAEKISKGDMSAEVDLKRKDEIGELGDSFSRMIASLKFEMMMRQEDEAAKREAEAAEHDK
jgi:adenylate cyclase